MGWFARGKMADAFENAAFKLKSGGLSDLIRTSYGYHIVKVEGYRAPRVPDLSEVRAQVELAIRREQAPAYTSEKAYELFELWLEQSKLALSEFAAANGAIANSSSGTLSASDDPEAQLPGLSRKLLELPQDTRRIIEIGDKTVIAEVREFVESDLPVLNEIRNKVLQRYKEKMSVEVAREQAREILDGVNKNVFASLKSAAEKFSLSHKEEKDIKRFSTASQILRDAKIKQAVFSTWANGTTLPEVYEFESKLYLLRVLSVAQPDPDSLRERVEENRLSLARTMGSTFAESLVNSMKAGSTIEIEAGVF